MVFNFNFYEHVICFFRTLLLVIKMIVEYCQCVDDAPMLTAEILTKLCEILKVSILRPFVLSCHLAEHVRVIGDN